MALIILFGAHLFADFTLQSEKMAEEKFDEIRVLIIHCLMYLACMLTACLLSFKINKIIWPVGVLVLSHTLIDWVRTKIRQKELKIFFIDQALHIGVILLVYYLFDLDAAIGSVLQNVIDANTADAIGKALMLGLTYLIALHPTGVLIRKVLQAVKQKDEESQTDENSNRIGYLIGMIERVLVVTLVLIGQMTAIGFVIAAKSLARFKQLEEQEFAESYLVGTLLSITIAFLCALAVKCIYQ